MLDLRAALGGRWAANVQGWLLLIFPAFLLVLLQESTRAIPSLSLIIVSTIGQHFAAGLTTGLIAVVARKRWAIIPIPVLIAMWVALGVSRGVAGAIACIHLGDGEGEFATRITFWISISLVWMPIFGFAAAQLDHRRKLLAEHTSALQLHEAAHLRSQQTTGELSARLVATIRDAIAPAIREISLSLTAVGPQLDPSVYRTIGDRIAAVSSDADAIIAGGTAIAQPAEYAPPMKATFLGAATSFERERPVFSGFLTGIALAAVIVPNALIADGLQDVAEGLIGVLFTTVILISLMVAQEKLARSNQARTVAILLAVAPFAGIAGSLMLVFVNFGEMDSYDWMLAAILPPGVAASALAISAAVGLSTANVQLELETTRLVDETDQWEQTIEARVEHVRASLMHLLHGPLQGRLAACVMALTFYAAESLADPSSERSAFVAQSVIEHLESVSRDLDALVTSGAFETSP